MSSQAVIIFVTHVKKQPVQEGLAQVEPAMHDAVSEDEEGIHQQEIGQKDHTLPPCTVVEDETDSVSHIEIVGSGIQIPACCRCPFVPYVCFWGVEDFISCLSGADTEVDILEIGKIGRIEQSHLGQ